MVGPFLSVVMVSSLVYNGARAARRRTADLRQSKEKLVRLLVTGGAGFIGANFVHLVRRERPDWDIVVFDKLTYAGRRDNLEPLIERSEIRFVHGDICDANRV